MIGFWEDSEKKWKDNKRGTRHGYGSAKMKGVTDDKEMERGRTDYIWKEEMPKGGVMYKVASWRFQRPRRMHLKKQCDRSFGRLRRFSGGGAWRDRMTVIYEGAWPRTRNRALPSLSLSALCCAYRFAQDTMADAEETVERDGEVTSWHFWGAKATFSCLLLFCQPPWTKKERTGKCNHGVVRGSVLHYTIGR